MPSARICRDIRPPVSHVGRYCKGAGSLPPVHRLTMFGPGVYWLGLLALTTAHTSSPSVSSRQGRIGDESCLRSGTFGQPTAVCDAAVNALLACTPVALSAWFERHEAAPRQGRTPRAVRRQGRTPRRRSTPLQCCADHTPWLDSAAPRCVVRRACDLPSVTKEHARSAVSPARGYGVGGVCQARSRAAFRRRAQAG